MVSLGETTLSTIVNAAHSDGSKSSTRPTAVYELSETNTMRRDGLCYTIDAAALNVHHTSGTVRAWASAILRVYGPPAYLTGLPVTE